MHFKTGTNLRRQLYFLLVLVLVLLLSSLLL
jgi:hypothetical protein